MNQFFSISRFAMLFKKHIVYNYKTYLLSAGVLAGILFLIIGLGVYANAGYLSLSAQTGYFISGMLMAGSIFTSLIFADLGNKKEAIPALTLPASSFEKFLVNWIVSFLIFQIIFIALFYFVAAVVMGFGHSAPGRENVFLNIFSEEQKAYFAFIIYAILHAILFFGAIYFEKLHFIKTSFTFFIGVFLLGLINKPILSSMFDQKVQGSSIFSPVQISNGKEAFEIHAPDVKDQTEGIVLGLVVVIIWISAYYKLKEKEV